MRTTQFVGLTNRADEYVKKNSVDINHNGDTIDDMFGSPYYQCATFTHKNGKTFEEYLQECPWSSGPMIFLALRYVGGNPIKSSLWISDESAREEEYNSKTGKYWV